MKVSKKDFRGDYLSTISVAKHKSEINYLEKQLEDIDVYRSKDYEFKNSIIKKIKRKKAMLEELSPPKLTSRQKDKMLIRKKEIEIKLKEVIVTDDEEYSDDYTKRDMARKKMALKMSTPYEEMQRELRRINRILDPQNETFNNLNYLSRR